MILFYVIEISFNDKNVKDLLREFILFCILILLVIFGFYLFNSFNLFLDNKFQFIFSFSSFFQILISVLAFVQSVYYAFLVEFYNINNKRKLKYLFFIILNFFILLIPFLLFSLFEISYLKLFLFEIPYILFVSILIFIIFILVSIRQSAIKETLKINKKEIYFKVLIFSIILVFTLCVILIENEKEIFNIEKEQNGRTIFKCYVGFSENFYIVDSEISCEFRDLEEIQLKNNISLNSSNITIFYTNELNPNYNGTLYNSSISKTFSFVLPKEEGYYFIVFLINDNYFHGDSIFLYDFKTSLLKHQDNEDRMFSYLVTSILISYALIQIYISLIK